MDDLGIKILTTSLPAFVIGHGLLALHFLNRDRWSKIGAIVGYAVTALCIAFGILVWVWA